METPTSAEVRSWSKLEWDSLEYEATDPDPLDVLVERSAEYVENCTGQTYAGMPTEFIQTAGEALQRRVEQLAYKSQENEAETASDVDMIASFGAGSYHENRVNLERATKFVGHYINPWPLLNDLLWRMTTEDKKEYWREQWGVVIPAFETTEVDWAGTLLVPSLTQRRSL